ncbi:ABC transporter ATP-binding protein [Candidatus Saccharibacteria bacterium]|nr:ABC transporter ATP-binding protein [Candidatus Saccharibacteria bacterium]
MVTIEAFRNVRKITKGGTRYVVGHFVCEAIMNLAQLLPPIATAGIIGVLTSGEDINNVWMWAILYLVFYATFYIPRIICWIDYEHLAEYYHVYIQKKLMEHVVDNDAIFDEVSKGKIIATCTDDIRWAVDVIDCSAMIFGKALRLLLIFGVFAANNIWVACLAALVDLIYVLLMNKNSKKYAKHFDGSRKYEDKAVDILNQLITNSKQIKAMNFTKPLFERYDRVTNKWRAEYKKRRTARMTAFVTDAWIVNIGKITLYVVLAYLVFNGVMTVDKLVLLVAYFEQVISATDEIRDSFVAVGEYNVKIKRILKILNFTQKSELEFGDIDNDYITGLVEFEDVSYRNKDKKWALKHVSFKARPNEITAVVGPRGAGKTLLINLLFRLSKVTSGRILVDGEDIYNYSKRAYRSNVSGVFENPFVLEMTVRENLALVDKNRKHQIAACKRVGLHDFIMKLPKGYDTVVSDEVMGAGEKQLLAVARAVLTRAEVLLFDGVQKEGVQSIEKLPLILANLKQDHTIILVTHEEELKGMADRVVKMDKGKVVSFRKVKKK